MLQKNQKGFSLIEVLIVAAIGSIVAVGMTSMITSFNKEFKAFDEKVAIQSLQTQAQNLLSTPAFCKCFVGTNTFDSTTLTWNGFPNAIAAAYDATCVPLGTAFLTVGTPIGNSNIVPASITLDNITETVVNSGSYSAQLNIGFDQSQLLRSRKNISLPFYFTVKTTPPEPPTARILDVCGSGRGISIGSNPPIEVSQGVNGQNYPIRSPGQVGPQGGNCLPGTSCVLKAWTPGAQDMSCPPNSIMTGIKVNTSGTAQNRADGDGPIIQSIYLKCTTLQ